MESDKEPRIITQLKDIGRTWPNGVTAKSIYPEFMYRGEPVGFNLVLYNSHVLVRNAHLQKKRAERNMKLMNHSIQTKSITVNAVVSFPTRANRPREPVPVPLTRWERFQSMFGRLLGLS